MIRYNTWLPGNELFAYKGSFVKTLVYAERAAGGRVVTDQVTVPNTTAVFGIKAGFLKPAMEITRPPKLCYSSTIDFVLMLRDSNGWVWEAPCPKQATVRERGWGWSQFVLSALQDADKATLTPPANPSTGNLLEVLLRRLANVPDVTNTTPHVIRLAYMAGRTPSYAQSGSVQRVSIANESTAALTWRVGDVKLTDGSRKPIKYAGAAPFSFTSGGSNRNQYSTAPFRGPYVAGQQSGTPWIELKANDKLNGMLDMMLASQDEFRNRHPSRLDGPFMHSFVPQTWDGGNTSQLDSWILDTPTASATQGSWQYRAFEGMARTWHLAQERGSTLGIIEKARTICMRFFDWVYAWLQSNPNAYYLPSKWTPIGWKETSPLPDNAYLDPHGSTVVASDLAVVLKGAIYCGLTGADFEKAKYVVQRCLQVLARIQVDTANSPMRGAFTLRPQNYDTKGFEQAEVLDALTLGLRYPQFFPRTTESIVSFIESALTVLVEYDPDTDPVDPEPPVDPPDPEPTDMSRLTTLKNQFIDNKGNTVRLKSVNWFGAESENRTPHGTWVNSFMDIIDDIKSMDFNCIRIPVSGSFNNLELIVSSNAINYSSNPEFEGKNAYQILDLIIRYAESKRLYVVLDHHRAVEGAGADGTPIFGSYDIAKWIDTWTKLATYFKDRVNVVGADIHNEPHLLTWPVWAGYAEQCGNAIHAVCPDWIIFVEGVGNVGDDYYWWGGQLMGVKTRPVVLTKPNRLAYSPHEYGQSVGSQTWLARDGGPTVPNYPANLNAIWKKFWGFIFEEEIAPIWIGEFGGHFGVDGSGLTNQPHALFERQWLARLTDYLNGSYLGDGVNNLTGTNKGFSFAYWSYNPNSVDTGGLVMDDWATHQTVKLALLEPLMSGSGGVDDSQTYLFKAGSTGAYDSFYSTYALAQGRTNVDQPSSGWSQQPPSANYTAARTSDRYVTFDLPKADGALLSGLPIRYNLTFENQALVAPFKANSVVKLDVQSTVPTILQLEMTTSDDKKFQAAIMTPTTQKLQLLKISKFLQYPTTSVDAAGDKTGDWTTPGDDYEPPIYDAVPFPGRRLGLVGDSITYANAQWNPPGNGGRFAYHSFGVAGWIHHAMFLANHPLELEVGLQPNTDGSRNSGYNWGIAGSKVADWWLESFKPLEAGGMEEGPMWNYNKYKTKVDIVMILGGTNDLAANASAASVVLNLKKACYQCAADGKWVFVQTIMPRTTDLLNGYTLTQQDVVRDRLKQVNDLLRAWITTAQPKNIFLVDTWDALVGPNGNDPHGRQSDRVNPNGASTVGNFIAGQPQLQFFPDGLHPGNAGAFVIGQKLVTAFAAAGVPARSGNAMGPLTAGVNLLANPTFTVTTTYPTGGWSTMLGRSIGLGPALTDATHPRAAAPGNSVQNNLGLGYTHGQVPDHWFVYRASNLDQESYSNFGENTWGALSNYPEVIPYMAEATWVDGALKSSIVTIGGRKAWRIEFAVPVTGNKNEAFILRTNLPPRQNGLWNNYGYESFPQTPPPVNNIYLAGDKIGAQAEVQLSNIAGLHSLRMSANFLSIDDVGVSNGNNATSGAVISGLAYGQNFWPPSIVDDERFHSQNQTLFLRTPIVPAPAADGPNQRPYLQLNLEVSVDASVKPGSVTILLFDPMVNKFSGPDL